MEMEDLETVNPLGFLIFDASQHVHDPKGYPRRGRWSRPRTARSCQQKGYNKVWKLSTLILSFWSKRVETIQVNGFRVHLYDGDGNVINWNL